MGVRKTCKISKNDKSKIAKRADKKSCKCTAIGNTKIYFRSAYIHIRSRWLRAFGGKSAIRRRRLVIEIEFTNIHPVQLQIVLLQ